MAKPKQKVLVKIFAKSSLEVWASSVNIDEISSIEGILEVHKRTNNAFVVCDPRYDIKEIAQEVRDLLLAEVPDVFRDD